MEEKILVGDLILMSDEEIKKAIEEYADALIDTGYSHGANYGLTINFDLCSDGRLRYINFISTGSQTMAEYKGEDITLSKKGLEVVEIDGQTLYNNITENTQAWESMSEEVQEYVEEIRERAEEDTSWKEEYEELQNRYFDRDSHSWDIWEVFFNEIHSGKDQEEWYRENYPREYEEMYQTEREISKDWLVDSIREEIDETIKFIEVYDQPLLKKFRDSLIEQELVLPN